MLASACVRVRVCVCVYTFPRSQIAEGSASHEIFSLEARGTLLRSTGLITSSTGCFELFTGLVSFMLCTGLVGGFGETITFLHLRGEQIELLGESSGVALVLLVNEEQLELFGESSGMAFLLFIEDEKLERFGESSGMTILTTTCKKTT